MKTDNIFYKIFQTLPEVLFELIGESTETASEYQFTSIQVKELARTIDGVFKSKEKTQPIYFIEVQFQREDNLYDRLLTEVFLYLGQYKPDQYWRGIVIWAKRSLAPVIRKEYEVIFAQNLIEIIYLDEIEPSGQDSIGLGIIELIIGKEETIVPKVQGLAESARRNITDLSLRRDIIELIEKVVIYKFPRKSNEELEAMFGLAEWKQTQFYQDVKAEGLEEGEVRGKLIGKLETIPGLLKLGLSPEQIAEALDIELLIVRQAVDELPK